MARKQRNYKAEYARRIASGLRRGLTHKEARGHAGDLSLGQKEAGAVVVKRGLGAGEVMGYLARLGESRRVKVLVARSDGSHQTLIGKKGGQRPSGARDRIEELIEEFGDLETAAEESEYTSAGATITSINVVYA